MGYNENYAIMGLIDN